MFSFTLKNEGDVQLNYSWCIQPGKYLPPEPEDDENANQHVKSSRNARKTAKPATAQSRQSGTKSRPDAMQTPNYRKTAGDGSTDARASQLSDKTTGCMSTMAHSVDGRPVSAMTLAYEASGNADFSGRGTDDIPYTIEPQHGSIPAGEEASFTVRFSPLEIDTFDAILLCQ